MKSSRRSDLNSTITKYVMCITEKLMFYGNTDLVLNQMMCSAGGNNLFVTICYCKKVKQNTHHFLKGGTNQKTSNY